LGKGEEKLKEALAKDHNYVPALIKMSELQYRNAQYKDAFELAKRALSIDTHDGGANYFYALAAFQLDDMDNARDGLTLASLSIPYRSAAYTALSELFLREKNYERALEYSSKALDFNRYNIAALQAQAICFRYLDHKSKAEKVLDAIASIDRLNAFVKSEKYFLHRKDDQLLRNLFQNELPKESYMELAITYMNKELWDEAEMILRSSPESPIAYYMLAWMRHQNKQEL
jgi:tetratricopeptide (TPR) repeat protein